MISLSSPFTEWVFQLWPSRIKHEYLYVYLSEGCVYFCHLCTDTYAHTHTHRHTRTDTHAHQYKSHCHLCLHLHELPHSKSPQSAVAVSQGRISSVSWSRWPPDRVSDGSSWVQHSEPSSSTHGATGPGLWYKLSPSVFNPCAALWGHNDWRVTMTRR